MKITQASIQTLTILAAATSINAASLRGSKEETVISPPIDSHTHHHVAGKGLGSPDDHVVAYQARRGEIQPKDISTRESHPHEGAKRAREPAYMAAYAASEAAVRDPKRARFGGPKNDEELNKLLGGEHGGTKKNRGPDHMMAYASSGGYGVKNDEELNKLLGGTKKSRGPDHMMTYASSGGYGNEYEAIGGGGYGGERGNFFGTPEVKHGRIEAPAPRNRGANVGLN